MHRGDPQQSIERQLGVLRSLEATVDALARRGSTRWATAWAEVASDFAWKRHTGCFVSTELERTLGAIGRALPSPPHTSVRPITGDPERILHVATHTRTVGGHSRLLRRAILHDSSRRHSLLFTRPTDEDTRRTWQEALDLPNGSLIVLPGTDPIVDAINLRTVAAAHDAVVLHTHPNDATPLIAFAPGTAHPPVLLVNHADHVFWLGASTADLVVCLRDSGAALSTARRGVSEDRIAYLPLPIDLPDDLPASSREADRRAARQEVGASGDVLAVAVGSAYKFRASGDAPGFIDLLAPVLDAHPRLEVLVVGPGDEVEWRQAEDRWNGRLRAVGIVPDATPYLRAADIYLDPYPVGSLTALLEGAAHGLPTLSCCRHEGLAAVLCCDDRPIDPHRLVARSHDEYASMLGHLVDDPAWRRDLGDRLSGAMRAVRTPTAWANLLSDCYRQAADLHRTTDSPDPERPTGPEPACDPLDLAVLSTELLAFPNAQLLFGLHSHRPRFGTGRGVVELELLIARASARHSRRRGSPDVDHLVARLASRTVPLAPRTGAGSAMESDANHDPDGPDH